MNSRERLLAQLRELCDEIGPEDGAPTKRKERRYSSVTQDQRLAGRVARSIALALGGCDDPLLTTLVVLDGRPDPDARRVLVRLLLPGAPDDEAVDQAHARLLAASGLLRSAVAADLARRLTPRLRFVVLRQEAP